MDKAPVSDSYDLIVVGAGSGGIGAALAAGRLGMRVLLVEKQAFLGGNAAQSGVSVWEMGVGGTGIPFDIYKKIKQNTPAAIGIYSFNKHRKWQMQRDEQPLHPGAELLIDPEMRYRDSLLRHGSQTGIENEAFVRKYWHGVPFEPSVYQATVEQMLLDTGNVTLLKETSCLEVSLEGGMVSSLELTGGRIVKAGAYVDSTDSGLLCKMAGCEMLFGQEARSVFGEPDAPEIPSRKINGVSLIYRISRQSETGNQYMADLRSVPDVCWWADDFPVASIVQYPGGDLNVNMLPTMEGNEFISYGDYAQAYEECGKRVLAHFKNMVRTYPPYQDYCITWIAPALGVREGSRVICEYVLTENDLLAGLSGQSHTDIITIADHPMDTHGKSTGRAGCAELAEPYGVPFRCLIPKGFGNLLIASRAAGFSSLAASSCRLSRTMMQMGQAAGTAAYLAKKDNLPLPEVSSEKLRSTLREQNVQLEFPLTGVLQKHLENE